MRQIDHLRAATPAVLLCWTAAAALWFGLLGTRALITPDEGRYASAALGMMQSGDWLTPRLNGFLYFEKPVLQYWISAASFKVLGINEFAARLWPGLSGFLAVIVLAVTARRLWGGQAGELAGPIAAGTTWIVANSHFLTLDMGLTFFLTLALCGFLLAQRDGATEVQQRRSMQVAWAAMAGAVMTKGLVGLVIPAATLVLYSLLERRWALWGRMHWRSGVPILLVLACPWFVAVSLENPGFFDFFFIREHFRRFLTDEAQRAGPLWYFVPFLLIGMLPWTSLLPGMLRLGMPGADMREQPASGFQPQRFLLLWAGFVLVFFSVSRSKLPSYILPMFPALCLLAARSLAQLDAGRIRRHLIPLAALCAALMAAAPLLSASHIRQNVPAPVVASLMHTIVAAAAVLLIGTVAAWFLLGRQRKVAAVWALSLANLLAMLLGMNGYDAYGRPFKSSKDIAALLAGYAGPCTPVFSVHGYDQTLPFYLRRPVTLVDFRGEFAYGEDAEPSRWISDLGAFAAQWRSLPQAAAIMPKTTYVELQQMQLPMRLLHEDPGRVVVLRSGARLP